MTSEHLLAAYQTLWLNRSFASKQATTSEDQLHEAIMKDLKDEMTHPRVRQTPYVKYHLGIKRILNSSLSSDEKVALTSLYTNLLDSCI
ncbi:hypothetical protein [Priestia megaterium]|uniref:hypothetical protein n=1 Tax=Priestia megaterium TaxID=1404 RepID=UPI00211D0A0D|nr:hypothetical protein [Priestia megaterium]